MAEPSDNSGGGLPMLGDHDPSQYTTKQAKERFAVAKFYGMGSDGEWTADEIAEALDCHPRTVYKYVHESDIGEDVREVLATTEAEWRLDMALKLRKTVEKLEAVEAELYEQQKAVATGYETKTVEGTPTGDRNIRLPDQVDTHTLKLPVPTDFSTVTDYSKALERVQKEKRQYIAQISDLLGLDAADRKEVDHTLASRHEEVKVVNIRESEDPYPTVDPIDTQDPDADVSELATGPEEVAVESVEDVEDGRSGPASDEQED